MKTKQSLIVSALLLMAAATSVSVWAEEATINQLPAEAREAFDNGMAAVGQQQWSVAIRSFLKAQKAAPESPEVLFNLGLAESKVPGRELRAMAWLQTYLFTAPAAANAGAVRTEIANLKVRVEGTMDRLIAQAGRLAAQTSPSQSCVYYSDIAVAEARLGDIAAAKRLASKAVDDKNRTHYVRKALSSIAVIQYNAGDIAGAEETINEIGSVGAEEVDFQSLAYANIACLQAMDGDFTRAEGTLNRGKTEGVKNLAYLFVAEKAVLAGKNDMAASMVARQLALPLKDMSLNLEEIMLIQECLGDLEGARKTNAKYIEDLRHNSFLSADEIANADRQNQAEIARADTPHLRSGLEYRTGGWAKAMLGSISRPDVLRLKLEIGGSQDNRQQLPGLLNKQLDEEFFTDQEGARAAMASGKTPWDIISAMLKAIETTTDLLDYIKILGR